MRVFATNFFCSDVGLQLMDELRERKRGFLLWKHFRGRIIFSLTEKAILTNNIDRYIIYHGYFNYL